MQASLRSDMSYSLSFNGTNQYVTLSTMQGMGLALNSDWLSLLFWLKTSQTTTGTIMGLKDPGNSNYFSVNINENNANTNQVNALHMFLRDSSNFFNNVQSDTSITFTDNQWHAIMMQINPPNHLYQFYIDKKVCPMISASSTIINSWSNFGTNLILGGLNVNLGGGSNVIPNPSFETDTSGWSLDPDFTRSNADAHDGAWSIKQTSTGGFLNFTTVNDVNGLSVTPNTDYTLSFWAKIAVVSGNPPIGAINSGSAFSSTITSFFPSDTGGVWQNFTVNFNTGSASHIWIRIFNNNGTVNAFYDQFSITTATDSTGTPTNFSACKIANLCLYREKLTQFDFLEYQRGMLRRQGLYNQYKMREGAGNTLTDNVNGQNGTLVGNVNNNMWAKDTPY